MVGIFSILGSILVGILHGSIRTWRKGENARQAYEKSAVVLDQLREDLTAIYTTESSDTFSPAKPVEIRMVCRYAEDPERPGTYKQEFAFIRSISQRTKNLTTNAGDMQDNDSDNNAGSDPVGRLADEEDNDGDSFKLRNNGEDDDEDGETDEEDEGLLGVDEPDEGIDEEWYNLVDDDGDGETDEDLRPLGDLMQVRYVWRGDTLYRGIQAPLAADKFPFDPFLYQHEDREKFERFGITGTPVNALATGVIYFGIRFWTPHTTAWDEALGKGDPDQTPDPDPGGPEELWDSTRALTLAGRQISVTNGNGTGALTLTQLDERPADKDKREVDGSPAEFYYYKAPTGTIVDYGYRPPVLSGDGYDTLFDVSDDVFPRRAQVTVVLTNTRGKPRVALLKSDLDESSEGAIPVDDNMIFRGDNHPYVKIDEEWIRYSHFNGDTDLIIAPGGRGARGTIPAAHSGGADVETGVTFVLTVDLPSYRELKE